MLHALLWLATTCWWVIYRFTSDVTVVQIRINLFIGAPDAMGSYEITTLEREFGPKRARA